MDEDKVTRLEKQVEELTLKIQEMNKDVFQSIYIERKYADFRNRIKVPSFVSTPSTGKVGELCEVGGKLYICSSANTWSLVGGQTP